MTIALGSLIINKNEKEVINNIKKIERQYKKVISWLQGASNIERTTEIEIIKNIMISTQSYLKYIENGAYTDIQILALGVRSILENLARYRFIMQSNENLNKWISESITDYHALIKGFMSLGNNSSQGVTDLKNELTRLNDLRSKYNFPEVKQPQQVKAMTDVVGLVQDYDTIFKLTSKLIHPSSLYINSNSTINNKTYHNILVIHGQLYTLWMYKEVTDKLSIPKEISDFP